MRKETAAPLVSASFLLLVFSLLAGCTVPNLGQPENETLKAKADELNRNLGGCNFQCRSGDCCGDEREGLRKAAEADPSICRYITTYNSTCLSYVAGFTKNISVCDGVSPDMRNYCHYEVAVSTNDSSLCRSDSCLAELASMSLDLSLCARVNDSLRKNSCMHDIAVLTRDVSLCENLSKTEYYYYGMCYGDIGKATMNISLCDKAVEGWLIQDCFYSIAASTKNISLCHAINDSWKDGCLFRVGTTNNDTDVCNRITKDNVRQSCANVVCYRSGECS